MTLSDSNSLFAQRNETSVYPKTKCRLTLTDFSFRYYNIDTYHVAAKSNGKYSIVSIFMVSLIPLNVCVIWQYNCLKPKRRSCLCVCFIIMVSVTTPL